MCIITDENDVIRSISIIPGVNHIPPHWNVYFPVKLTKPWPREGDVWKPEAEEELDNG